ncbi:Arylacetonitrilase [Colletotrichum spinosum]|uniref:nitrilase n=1 Tax=Colletotrichum spinosum TaxID=1347390 RepID=A0A4R8QJ07_9PEZI|nr:Arylacetonitrilase [Colletotrichum spinosum]
MSPRTVRVACTQAEPAWLDLPAAVAKTCHLIAEASSRGAQLVAFPECWIPGYPLWIWSRPLDFDLNLACWEHIQPLLKFNTIAQREEIHVAAWPSLTPHSGGGPDMWSMSAEGCQTLSRTYAIEANAFVLHCTAVVSSKGVEVHGTAGGAIMNAPGGGSSAIFGPDGRRLTEPVDDTAETILYADLDMDAIHRTEMFADCTGHYSRPDLMRLVVDGDIKTAVLSHGDAERDATDDETALVV